MEFEQKARIRLERWVEHGDHHREDYEQFARELDEAGRHAAAQWVRQTANLEQEANRCLRKALEALEEAS